MSCVTYGAVFSRTPLKESELAKIDRILTEGATQLGRTRRGRVWEYTGGGVHLDVRIEDVEKVLWDCEDDLLALGLLPESGNYRVAFTAGYCNDEADREIGRLCGAVAEAIGGTIDGPRRCH